MIFDQICGKGIEETVRACRHTRTQSNTYETFHDFCSMDSIYSVVWMIPWTGPVKIDNSDMLRYGLGANTKGFAEATFLHQKEMGIEGVVGGYIDFW